MNAVVSVIDSQKWMATRMFPADVLGEIAGAGRAYLFFMVDHRAADVLFADPSDGLVLIECRYFDSEPAARAWVAQDIALREWSQ